MAQRTLQVSSTLENPKRFLWRGFLQDIQNSWTRCVEDGEGSDVDDVDDGEIPRASTSRFCFVYDGALCFTASSCLFPSLCQSVKDLRAAPHMKKARAVERIKINPSKDTQAQGYTGRSLDV